MEQFKFPEQPPFVHMPLSQVQYGIIHHAAVEGSTPESIDRSHRNRGFKRGIGYHAHIAKGGLITLCRPWDAVGGHVIGYNNVSWGICLDGNLENHPPTKEQMVSLLVICRLMKRMKPSIKFAGHKDFAPTLCPGKYFPWNDFKRRLVMNEYELSLAKKSIELGILVGNGTPESLAEPARKIDIIIALSRYLDRAKILKEDE